MVPTHVSHVNHSRKDGKDADDLADGGTGGSTEVQPRAVAIAPGVRRQPSHCRLRWTVTCAVWPTTSTTPSVGGSSSRLVGMCPVNETSKLTACGLELSSDSPGGIFRTTAIPRASARGGRASCNEFPRRVVPASSRMLELRFISAFPLSCQVFAMMGLTILTRRCVDVLVLGFAYCFFNRTVRLPV